MKKTPLLLSLLLLVGCRSTSSSSSSSTSSSSSSSPIELNGFHKAESINENMTLFDVYSSQSTPNLPSIGEYDILVLPIEIEGYPFADEDLQTIEIATTGSAEETGYWETLPSYYEKSSYGALRINCEVAPVVKIDKTPQELLDSTSDPAAYCLNVGLNQYKGDVKKFDHNGDGLIDATIMIYSCPDAGHSREIASIDPYADYFWAYTFFNGEALPDADPDDPVGFYYFWSSLDFFQDAGEGKIDCHTIIHEFGHILGADDYYDADFAVNGYDNPAGGSIMMDCNVGDMDMATKLLYGWSKPYVVSEDSTLTIKPSESSGDCILIADNWNGTGFDEFLLLELYTPTGLNELDSKQAYPDLGATLPSEAGVKLWHVDNRLVYGPGFLDGMNFQDIAYLTDEETASGEYKKYSLIDGRLYANGLAIAASNSDYARCVSLLGQDIFSLQLIQAGGEYTFDRADVSTANADLFHTGDTFDMEESEFFPSGKLNNGASLPISISFDSVSGKEAKITITYHE